MSIIRFYFPNGYDFLMSDVCVCARSPGSSFIVVLVWSRWLISFSFNFRFCFKNKFHIQFRPLCRCTRDFIWRWISIEFYPAKHIFSFVRRSLGKSVHVSERQQIATMQNKMKENKMHSRQMHKYAHLWKGARCQWILHFRNGTRE